MGRRADALPWPGRTLPVRDAVHLARIAHARIALAVWGERARCGWAPLFPIVDAEVESVVTREERIAFNVPRELREAGAT